MLRYMIYFKSEVFFLVYCKLSKDSAFKYKQTKFLTNENDPFVQMDVMYKSKSTLYEYIKTRDYRKVVINVARKLNFNMSSIGTTYFIEALLYLFQNGLSIKQSNEAFKLIAEQYDTSVKRVRANITNALNSMNRFSDKKLFIHYFPEYDGRNPSLIYSLSLALERMEDIFK